jgi:hypothetical protein
MSNIVYDAIMGKVPNDRKKTAGGWTSFNGPCCVYNGQVRADTRKRAGVRMSPEGVCIYHCFNCSHTATWGQGRNLSKKMKSLLEWFGIQNEELKRLNFKIWQLQEQIRAEMPVQPAWVKLEFKENPLPDGAKPLAYWLENDPKSKDFEEVVAYLAGRGEDILTTGEYYWTPSRKNDLHRRITIPFYWQGKIVGWTARAIFPTRYRYYTEVQAQYIYNTEMIDSSADFVFLNEGPLDAKAVNGLATLGDHITPEQCQWLNQLGKKIVVVPDRMNGGGNLVDAALREGWFVSFPKWDAGVKDAADAVKKYGRLYATWSILDAKTNNRLQIQIERKRLK